MIFLNSSIIPPRCKSIKRTLFLLLFILLSASAYSAIKVDGIYYNTTRLGAGDMATVTYGSSKYSGSVTIPETISYGGLTYSVTSIDAKAFEGCSSLTSISIPGSVTRIGNYAFKGCVSLTDLRLEDGENTLGLGYNYESISTRLYTGQGLFYDCPLQTLYVGRNLSYETGQKYGYSPFYKTNISSVTIGNSVSLINSELFIGTDLAEIKSMASTPPMIYDDSFSQCTYNSAIVTVPDESLTAYQSSWSKFYHIFSNKNNFYSGVYNLGKAGSLINLIDLSRIEDYESLKVSGPINGTDLLAINKMTRLRSLDLSEASIEAGGMNYYESDNQKFGTSDNSLGTFCVYNLALLKEVRLPNNLKNIGYNAFKDRHCLSSISIPASVLSISNRAFEGCTSLTDIRIEDSEQEMRYGDKIFDKCPLQTLYLGRNISYQYGTSGYDDRSPFYEKTNLNVVTVGNLVTSIMPSTFHKCTALQEVHIFSLVAWCNIDFGNLSANPCDYAHKLYLYDELLTDIIIPQSVTKIKNYTFGGCSELTSVTTGNYVTSIGEYAFNKCSALTSFTIVDSVILIGANAFSDCSALSSVTFGNAVTDIGTSAFSNCYALTNISIPNNVISIGSGAFSNCISLSSVTISNSITSISVRLFKNCCALTNITIPGAVREIKAEAFDECSELKTINMINPIPAVIETSTFPSSVLAEVTLNVPDDSKIKYWLHPYWGQFKSIEIWNGGSDSKVAQDELTMHITSEENLTAELASIDNVNMSTIVVPKFVYINGKSYTIAGIANNAFANTKLETAVLPSTISYVGVGAFANCDKLESLTIESDLPPSVADESFDSDQYSRVKLLVPSDAVYYYSNHTVWGKFSVEEMMSGIDEIVVGTKLKDAEWENCDIFNLKGTCLKRNATCNDFDILAPGYYIVGGRKIVKK